jgi:uncharacterized protein YecT (DUF1311 family)
VRTSQKAWEAYRDAYLEATFPAADKAVAYGSMYVMDYNRIKAKLIQAHTADLRELLRAYKEH